MFRKRFQELSIRERTLRIIGLLILVYAALSAIRAISYQVRKASGLTFSPRNSSLPPSPISSIDFDHQGKVWIGSCFESGLSVYDGTTWDRFPRGFDVPFGAVRITRVDPQGSVWVGTRLKGLWVYDGKNWINYTRENSDLGGNMILDLASDPDGRMWVGTDWGLSIIDNGKWQLFTMKNSDLMSNRIQSIRFDALGRAWLGTTGGLTIIDGDQWQTYTTENSDLVSDEILVISFDDQGLAWIGSEEGVNTFDGQKWTSFTEENTGVRIRYIREILFSPAGEVWMYSAYVNCGIDISKYLIIYDGESWATFSRIGVREINDVGLSPTGEVWIAVEDSILVSGMDSSQLNVRSATAVNDPPDLLAYQVSIPVSVALLLIGLLLYPARNGSGYWKIALVIPVLSIPIMLLAGFSFDAQDLYIPFSNILGLMIGIRLGVMGVVINEKRVISIVAVCLNVFILVLYGLQFFFWATFH